MNRRLRRALLLLALVVFALITPVIVLYALGFRPASSRVGVLLLESIPRRAQVIVNGEHKGQTPYTVSGRGGSVVHVSIEREGYQAWQKRLPLVTGVTTEARGVRLIPEELHPQEFAAGVSTFTLSPNRALIAVADERMVRILDEERQLVLPPIGVRAFPTSLLWSPDSTLVLIRFADNTVDLISLTEGARQTLPLTPKTGPAALAWDPRTPGRLLYLSANETLLAYDTRSTRQQVLAQQVTAFAPSHRNITLVSTGGQLHRITLSGGAISDRTLSLPKTVDRLSVSPGGYIALTFSDRVAALVQGGALLNLASSVESFGFSPNGELLYLQTAPNELRVFNIDDERLTHVPRRRLHLITRLSQPIMHPQWFAGSQHLVYQLGDQIILSEIDTRDHVVSHVLDSTNMTDAAVTVGEDGESLFYLKRTGEKTDLIRTSLMAE